MIKEPRERIVVMADLHCGALTGLLPPAWWPEALPGEPRRAQLDARRRALWRGLMDALDELRPIDQLIINGDLIHGVPCGRHTDMILFHEMDAQRAIAIDAIKLMNIRSGLILSGDKPHMNGKRTPCEQLIADAVGYRFFSGDENYQVRNTFFNLKHKIGGPLGRQIYDSALRKEYQTLVMNHHEHGIPKQVPHVIVRSHRHVYADAGGATWLGVVTPCLRVQGNDYRTELVAGLDPEQGIVVFDVYDAPGEYTYMAKRFMFKDQGINPPRVITLRDKKSGPCENNFKLLRKEYYYGKETI